MKKATTDIFGKTFYEHMFAFLLGIYIEVEFINNKVDGCVSLLETAKELSKVKVLTQQCMRVLTAAYPHNIYIASLFNINCPNGLEMVSHSIFKK